MCLFFCFPDDPIGDDPRISNPNTFHVNLGNACCKDPCCCLASAACPHAAACYVRYRALGSDLKDYTCCQGYYRPPCMPAPGQMGESSCPAVCLALESCFCLSCAVTATRMHLMDKYSIHPDAWDYQIIRCNNAIQCLACICNLAACFIEDLRDGARCLNHVAHITFCSVQACMQTQAYDEVVYREKAGAGAIQAPVAQKMEMRL